MRILRFDVDGRSIEHHGSRAFTHFRIAALAGDGVVNCIRLGPGGLIGRHAAAAPQLFLVVEGAGSVSGGDGHGCPIRAGEGAYWEPGEEHETRTDDGLVAVVLEGGSIEPLR